ncbi:MAG: response regulator transcription factor [Polyangia bacterium]
MRPVSQVSPILVVDDDAHIRSVVRFTLEAAGYRVTEAADGVQALALCSEASPALLVLDIMMPGLDGIEVCRRLRRSSTVPIVFMSCRDEEVDRIIGLEIGGDDYVTKPFSPRELLARVRAVLRRARPEAPADGPPRDETVLRHGALTLDTERFEARWGDRGVPLTVTEQAILRVLLSRPGKVFAREALIDAAYGPAHALSDRTIDSHVRRVRQKLAAVGADVIETVHGAGYRLRDG